MELKFNIVLLLITAVYTCSVTAECPDSEYLYSCKAQDEEEQDLSCTCMELKEKGKYNCTCFVDDPPATTEVDYLDCLDAFKKGQTESGVYSLKPDNMSPFKAYCDMETDGGGWTVFQRREDGSVDFYLNWADYVHGFGNTSGEYWLGLSKLHRLANGSVSTQLRVDLRANNNGTEAYAKYSTFYIGGSTTDYTLHVSGYSGTAGDSLAYNNLQKFTTKDNDNDAWGSNCAVSYIGAWWYDICSHANLNGHYGDHRYAKGVYWYHFKGFGYTLPFSEMKVRRA